MTDNRIDINSWSSPQLDMIARHLWAEEMDLSGDPYGETAQAIMADAEQAWWGLVNLFQGFRYPDDPDAPHSSGLSNPLMQEAANGLCYLAYTQGKRTAMKLAEANGKLEAHLRANDGTEIWNTQCARLRRDVARLQDRTIVWRLIYRRWVLELWPVVAKQLYDDGMEWVERRWSAPEETKRNSEVRRVSTEAYLAELNAKRTTEILDRGGYRHYAPAKS